MQKLILIVEDEPAIRDLLALALSRAEFAVAQAADTRAAMLCIAQKMPDLIVLDWMLPGQSGIEFARRLRRDEQTRTTPIIMLTARGEEDDRVAGLEAGVDDYISKPFSPRELVARVRAVIRRAHGESEANQIDCGELRIDAAAHRVTVGNVTVKLGPSEYRLLYFFATHPDRVFSRAQLLDHVWGGDAEVDERTVDVHIRRVRRALEPHQQENLIQTVRGTGYRFSRTPE